MRNKAVRSFLFACLRAACCLAVGLAIGAVALTAIAFAQLRSAEPAALFSEAVNLAAAEGLLPLLRGGEARDLLTGLSSAVPVLLLAVGAAYAWQAGLYNLGGGGQYALGSAALILCAYLGLPWYVCLTAAALAGGLGGMVAGLLKARFQVHEGLATALMNWLCIYGAQAALQSVSGGMSVWPDFRWAAVIVAGALCVLCTVKLYGSASGLEMRLLGGGEAIARYAGAQAGGTAVRTMFVSGLLGGMAGGLAFLLGTLREAPALTLALTGPGLHGIAAATLACGHPLGAALLGVVISHLAQGAQGMNTAVFPPETGEMVLAVILYTAACLALPGKTRRERRGKA